MLALVGVASDLLERSLLAEAAAGEFPTDAEARSSDVRQAVIGAFQGSLFVLTAAFFIAWLHRAYRNLPAIGAVRRRFGEGWAVGAWFVPFLSLWRPKEIVNDVWRASDPAAPASQGDSWFTRPVPRTFLAWWLAFLATQFLRTISSRWTRNAETLPEIRTANTLYLVSDSAIILSSLLALYVVRRTTRRQRERAAVLDLVAEEDPVPIARRRSTWAASVGVAAAVSLQWLIAWATWSGALDPTGSNLAGPGAAAPAAAPGVLIADDFSTRAGAWPRERNDEVEMGYVGDKYRIRIKQPSEWFSFAAFAEEVDAVRIEVAAEVVRGTPADPFGVGCWRADDVGYLAILFPNGAWAILKDPPRGDEYRELAQGRERRAIGPAGEANELRLECTRSAGSATVALWANGSKLGEARDTDPIPPFRALSLFAGSEASADVLFDEVIAREIGP